ncbi:MAG: hypothetical protein AAF810_12000 [Cyanobacteria bacterium P01_D01_bin.36]
MPALQFSNNLGLAPPSAAGASQAVDAPTTRPSEISAETSAAAASFNTATDFPTEFVFDLPMGYVDAAGRRHRRGVMRLARTVDEIEPMADPQVQANPAYATVIILSRVILALGELPAMSPAVIEGLFAGDLNYLQTFYRQINGLPA